MATINSVKDKLSNKANSNRQTTKNNGYSTIQNLLSKMTPEIKKALPKHVSAERIARITFTEIRKNPKLLNCSQASLLGAIMTAAQLGLEPGPTGQCYLIPYRNKRLGTVECQFQIGYKGLLDLFYRSEGSLNIDAHEVCENDVFEFEYGLNANLKHKPALTDRGKAIAYYAVAHLKGGGYSFLVMSFEDIENIRKRAKAKEFSPWVTDYDEMAKKTVIKRLCKYLPLSIELQRGLSNDETTKREVDEDMTMVEDQTDWIDIDASDDEEEYPQLEEEVVSELKEKPIPNKAIRKEGDKADK
jgi:recombination protein RecT